MSYDISLVDDTGETITLTESHDLKGGTFALGGTTECWLNVTWNYGGHFRRVLGPDGIRTIYGMRGAESIPLLEAAAAELGDNESPDYWEATEGNARAALRNLIGLARLAPHGIWEGD